jgi:membrane fusion protein (multidrug efflux system)
LRDTAIRSPVGGVIEEKYVNVGAYVEAPTLVFSVVDNSRLELETPVPSAQLGRVATGQRVRFRVNSYPAVDFEGAVIEVSPTVDAASRSAKVRVQVNNASGRLKAGMFAQGEIITSVREQSIVIPAAAVYRTEGSVDDTYVYLVQNNRAVQRKVRLAVETGTSALVAEGLVPGDLLVDRQSIELADDVRVQPES